MKENMQENEGNNGLGWKMLKCLTNHKNGDISEHKYQAGDH